MMDHPNIAKVLDAGATEIGPAVLRDGAGARACRSRSTATASGSRRASGWSCSSRSATPCSTRHTKGIIHRDLKPTNVLVAVHDGVAVPKVIDFGVAKATGQQPLTDRTLFTQFAQMVGTPLYMSPEQAEQGGIDVDTRSDVYSLGVLLYELLTGTTPFDGKRLREAGVRRGAADHPRGGAAAAEHADRARWATSCRRSPRSRRPEPKKLGGVVRGELDWIVMKCLEKDRARRYETANALALDVQRHLDNEPIAARAPGALYRLRKFARRNRAAVLTAILLVSVMVAATVVSTWQAVRATTARAGVTARRGGTGAWTRASSSASRATPTWPCSGWREA